MHKNDNICLNFNPRPREEGDFQRLQGGLQNQTISIHALVKRATFILFNSVFP